LRGFALLGGVAIVGGSALWHRASAEHGPFGAHRQPICAALGIGYFCDAVSGLRSSLKDPIATTRRAAILPLPETPGAVDPDITQATIDRTICRPGYARSVRPAYAVTGALKRRLMQARHPGAPMTDYELDHLIPISLGGAPFDTRDLWLQPRRGQANAGDKNALAYVLWRLVCEHRVPLRTAQHAIRHDWTKAYDTYATPENLARYHFRHRAEERE
jgi:hypothetical protein